MKTAYTEYKKKTAGIITFHSAYNFGAVLQAYALQTYLSQNFIDTRIIDYHNIKIDQSYSKPGFKELLHKPKHFVFRWMQYYLNKGKNKHIDEFRNDYLKLTKRFDADNIIEANSEADFFVTGSDQVWNYMIIGKDTTFFLDFVNQGKKTCSYAASIGVNSIPPKYIELYKEALSKIGKISIREVEGVQLLADIGITDATVMPDPTLLLTKEQWDSLCIAPNLKKKYILVYKITKADGLIQFAKNISKKTGYQIIYIPNDLKSGIVGSIRLNIGPREWLGYIKNAEYVITNSFHGTLFSILFGTKFFSEVSEKVNPSTSRLKNLLFMFGLNERRIENYKDELLSKNIQYEKVKALCEEQRNKAYVFFKDAIDLR